MQSVAIVVWAIIAALPPPEPTGRVHDFARLLTPADSQVLEKLAQDVEHETTAQLFVITVPSLDGKTIEAYANELFNHWGMGQRDVNNGVLLLVAPHERRMRIEVGFGLEPLLTDALCGEIRDDYIIPQFKQNNMPAGIVAGAKQLAAILRAHPAAARGVPGSAPVMVRTPRRDALWATGIAAVAAIVLAVWGRISASRRLYSTVTFFLASTAILALLAAAVHYVFAAGAAQLPKWLLGGAGLTAAGSWLFNWRKYRRFGPHGCSKCGTRLQLLDEQADDAKLSEVQQLEEKIGSVEYDVWFCPACLHVDTESYVNRFSSFKECPECHRRTFKEDPQKVVSAATTLSSGLARVEGRCVACKAKRVRDVVLPMIVASSSSFGDSSGGGGGGGSSGGGGASGGW